MKTKQLTHTQTVEFLNNESLDKLINFDCDSKNHTIFASKNLKRLFEIKLPLSFPVIEDNETLETYINRLPLSIPPYFVILIQSDHAAIGYFENGKVVNHKAIRSYMSRKKQGKNELTYLNSGKRNKSAGSQIRYQNALHFFEEINEKLNEWNKITHPARIFFSCPIKMIQYLHKSNTKCFFEKGDSRICKVSINNRVPSFEVLQFVNRNISLGNLVFS